MKLIKLSVKLLILACLIIACTNKKTTDLKLKKIYVESGKIDKNTFVGTAAFAANDTVIGKVDSTTKKSNGYLGSNNFIYLFEGNTIPETIKALPEIDIAEKLVSAKWKNDTVYKLKNDAFLLEKPPVYYIREKGKYKREIALIDGFRVFRTENKFVIENYTNLLSIHKELRTDQNPIDFFKALGISPESHSIFVSRAGLVVDANTGNIDNKKSTATPKNTQDKITFKPKKGGDTFRLRVVVAKYEKETKKKFFNQSGMIPSSLNKQWNKYLNKNILRNYIENGLKGFDGSPTLELPLTADPPPPVVSGTGE